MKITDLYVLRLVVLQPPVVVVVDELLQHVEVAVLRYLHDARLHFLQQAPVNATTRRPDGDGRFIFYSCVAAPSSCVRIICRPTIVCCCVILSI